IHFEYTLTQREYSKSAAHSLRFRIIHGPERGIGGKAFAGDLDLVGRTEHVRFTFTGAGHIAKSDRAAEMVAIIAGSDRAHDLSVTNDGFVMEEERLGVFQAELDEPP